MMYSSLVHLIETKHINVAFHLTSPLCQKYDYNNNKDQSNFLYQWTGFWAQNAFLKPEK